jgi:hypothetical protein
MFINITSRLQRLTRDILTSENNESSGDEEDKDDDKQEKKITLDSSNPQTNNSRNVKNNDSDSLNTKEKNESDRINNTILQNKSSNSLQDSSVNSRLLEENSSTANNSNFLTKLVHKQQEELSKYRVEFERLQRQLQESERQKNRYAQELERLQIEKEREVEELTHRLQITTQKLTEHILLAEYTAKQRSDRHTETRDNNTLNDLMPLSSKLESEVDINTTKESSDILNDTVKWQEERKRLVESVQELWQRYYQHDVKNEEDNITPSVDVSSMLDDLRTLIEKQRTDLNILSALAEKLSRENGTLRAERHDQAAALTMTSALKEQLQTLQHQHTELAEKLCRVESDLRQANVQCAQLQTDIATLRTEREQLLRRLCDMEDVLQEKERQLTELTASSSLPSHQNFESIKSQLEAEVQSLKLQLTERNEELVRARQQCKQLESEIERWQEKEQQIKLQQIEELDAKDREINKLSKNLERLKSHLLDTQHDAEETILDLKKTIESYKAKEERYLEMERTNQKLQKQWEERERQYHTVVTELSNLQSVLNGLQAVPFISCNFVGFFYLVKNTNRKSNCERHNLKKSCNVSHSNTTKL